MNAPIFMSIARLRPIYPTVLSMVDIDVTVSEISSTLLFNDGKDDGSRDDGDDSIICFCINGVKSKTYHVQYPVWIVDKDRRRRGKKDLDGLRLYNSKVEVLVSSLSLDGVILDVIFVVNDLLITFVKFGVVLSS